MKLNFDIAGLDELEKALKELRAEMGGKEGNLVASALREGAKDILVAQVSAAARHQKTGTLINSLKIKKHPNPKYLSELYGIGVHNKGKRPRKGEDQNTGLPWYADIVEFGGHGKRGPLRGFIRQSLEQNRAHALATMRKSLATKIERVAKKIGNKNAAAVAARVKSL